jgi:hypothetical protein
MTAQELLDELLEIIDANKKVTGKTIPPSLKITGEVLERLERCVELLQEEENDKPNSVFVVIRPAYDSYSDTTYEEVEQIFATEELAKEFVSFEIGQYSIEERPLHCEALPSTVRTKQKVAEGIIQIIPTKQDGNVFKFGGGTKKTIKTCSACGKELTDSDTKTNGQCGKCFFGQ